MDKANLKTIGILGGMGPLATSKLLNDIILNTVAHRDQDHIPILIHNNTSIADRTAYIIDSSNENPLEELIKSARILEYGGSDFIIMPCNTAHYFYEDIQESVSIPVLNMIEDAIKLVIEKGFKGKVGLLATDGTIKAEVYHDKAKEYGLEIVTPKVENQKEVMKMIYNIKEDVAQENLEGVYKAIEDLTNENVDIIIAGCTEVSVALEMYDIKGNFIDPMKIMMNRSIKLAGGQVKNDLV